MRIECDNDPILQEDLEIVANGSLPFEKFRNASFFITGGTGLIGSQIVKTLACCNRLHKLNIKINLLIRNEKKARILYGNLLDREDIVVLKGDILQPCGEYMDEKENIDYIIHTASITKSKMMIEHPVDTICTSVIGTKNILELARNKKCKGVVYVSSMEMYGKFEKNNNESPIIDELKLGYINTLDVRSNYPESKRLCENMCVAYMEQYSVPVCIARLSQTFGAGMLPGENRVFAQFAKSVINEKDIVLHTLGKSEGNYCYTRDTVKAMILLLLKGKPGEAYNVSNENSHTTIVEMANMLCKEFTNDKIKVIFDIPQENKYGYASDTSMKLNSSKMRSLGWKPEVDLKESYYRMICSMKYTGNY